MSNTILLQKILSIDESLTHCIIKSKQLILLQKLLAGQELSENEKRYLRGNLGKKLAFLAQLWEELNDINEYQSLLNIIDSYYITGLEALKYYGFGWFYDTKIIEIINTRLEGKIRLKNKTLKFYRVKSISKKKFVTDELTGLKYATTEQVIIDTRYTRNEYAKIVWKNMLNRYWYSFLKNPNKFKKYQVKKSKIVLSDFGV